MKPLMRLGRHAMRSCDSMLVAALLFIVVSNSTATATTTKETVEEPQDAEPVIDVAPVTVDGAGLFRAAVITIKGSL